MLLNFCLEPLSQPKLLHQLKLTFYQGITCSKPTLGTPKHVVTCFLMFSKEYRKQTLCLKSMAMKICFTINSKFYCGATITDFDQEFSQWISTIEVVLTTENKVHSDYDLSLMITHNHA